MGVHGSSLRLRRLDKQIEGNPAYGISDWNDLAGEWGIAPALGGDLEQFIRSQQLVAENYKYLSAATDDPYPSEAGRDYTDALAPLKLDLPHLESTPSRAPSRAESEAVMSPGEPSDRAEDDLSDGPSSPSLAFMVDRHSSIRVGRSESQMFNEIAHGDPTGRLLPRALSRTFYSPFRPGYASKVLSGPQGSFSQKNSVPEGETVERQSSGPLEAFLQAGVSPLASPSSSLRDVGGFFRNDAPSPISLQMRWPEEPSSPSSRLPSLIQNTAQPPPFTRLSEQQSPGRLRVNLLREESSMSMLGRRSSLPGGMMGNNGPTSAERLSAEAFPDLSDRPSDRPVLPPISTGSIRETSEKKPSLARERSSIATLARPTAQVESRSLRASTSGIAGPVAFGRTQALKKMKSHQARFSEGGEKRSSGETSVLASPHLRAVPEKPSPETSAHEKPGKEHSESEAPRLTRSQYNAAAMVMQRSVDRANAQVTEALLHGSTWSLPINLVSAQRVACFAHDLELQSYRDLAEAMLSSGKIAIQLMAANDYTLVPSSPESTDGSDPKYVDLWSLDPHDLIDARTLLKHESEIKVRAGLGVRFIAATAAEVSRSIPGSNANLKLIIHCNEAQKEIVASDLASRSFCGFSYSNVFLVIQDPNQAGYLYDEKEARFLSRPVTSPETAPMSRGDGFSMFLMSVAGRCWSMARDGSLSPLPLPAHDVLLQLGVEWLITCSVRELSPPNMDVSSLAALAYARARGKAGVVAEVALEPSIIQARRHEGIFLMRKQEDGTEAGCNLFTIKDFAAGTEAHRMVSGFLSSNEGSPVIPCGNGRYFWHLPSLITALATPLVFSPRLTLSPNPPTLVNVMLELGDLFSHLPHPELREWSKSRALALGKTGAASPNLLHVTRSQDAQLQNALIARGGSIQSPRRIFIVLVEKNQATKAAVNLAMSLAKCDLDKIHLLSVRASDAERMSGREALSSYVQQVRFSVPTPVREVVLALSPGELLLDILDDYASQCAASTKNPGQNGSVVFILGTNSVINEGSTALAVMKRLVTKHPVVIVTSNNESSIGTFNSLALSPVLTPVKAGLVASDFPNSRSSFELMINNGLLFGDRGDEITLFSPPGSAKQVLVDTYSKAAKAFGIDFQPPFVLDVPQGSQVSPLGVSGVEESISSGVDENKIGLLAIQLPQNQTKSIPTSIVPLLASCHAPILFAT